jgi:hypothetical protein
MTTESGFVLHRTTVTSGGVAGYLPGEEDLRVLDVDGLREMVISAELGRRPDKAFRFGKERFRLRPRAVLTNQLADASGWLSEACGDVARGAGLGLRWTDLQSKSAARRAIAYMQLSLGTECEVVGGDLVTTGEGQQRCYAVEIRVEEGQGTSLSVLPALLAHLRTGGALRDRSSGVVATFRVRATTWLKEMGVPDFEAALVLPGTLALAVQLSQQERAAIRWMSRYATTEAGKLAVLSRTGVAAQSVSAPLRALPELGPLEWISRLLLARFGRRATLPVA